MTVGAKPNGNYKVSELTNQKYLPLDNVTFTPGSNVYDGLLISRLNRLIQRKLVTQRLEFTTSVPRATVIANEAGHLPPLVVVSANRATWVQDSLTTAQNLATADYGDVGNLNALLETPAGEVLPVIYAAKRRGQNRNTYLVVHSSEYAAYRRTTAGLNVTVVGWQFRKAPGHTEAITGFGASRYAAIEFCKLLRRLSPAPPWNYAWLVDDNVVALTNFAGLAAVEAAMGPATVAAGFQADTRIGTTDDVLRKVYQRGIGPVNALPPVDTTNGIIQQTSLWNIAYLDTNHLNFSPAYVTSAEDTSITYYLKATGKLFLFYPAIGILKCKALPDQFPSNPLADKRQEFTAMFTRYESSTIPAQPAPPPVTIDVTGSAPAGTLVVSSFVRKYFGTDPLPDEVGSRMLEQITVESIKQSTVAPRVMNQAFQVNQGNDQPTRWQ